MEYRSNTMAYKLLHHIVVVYVGYIIDDVANLPEVNTRATNGNGRVQAIPCDLISITKKTSS
jgi:hypothetical protein